MKFLKNNFPLEISKNIFYSILMEDCTICFTGTKSWKTLPCQHKLCETCYLKLDNCLCPYCRKKFTYTKDELKKRSKMNINYNNWHPPSQLVIPEEFTRNNSNLPVINDTLDNDFPIMNNPAFSRMERNRIRRRRRNLSQKEYIERRKRIKKKSKMKWLKKKKRAEKIRF